MTQSSVAESPTSTQWFSKSKTRAPKFDVPLIDRPRLLVLLDEALRKNVSTIIAPAGFGKSTLLSQWCDLLAGRNVPFVWLNLDESDHDIRHFLAYLVMAIDDACIPMPRLRKMAENGFVGTPTPAIIKDLFEALGKNDRRFVLILDDYHRMDTAEVSSFVTQLSAQFEDTLHISISSRTTPDISLPKLLASGSAIEISSAALLFSKRETARALGKRISPRKLSLLHERVEGWPVAVQMAKLVGEEDIQNGKHYLNFSGSRSHLADYLTTNILNSQKRETRDFLLETSVLRSFNVELANAVRGEHDGLAIIQQLEHLNALVTPLDDKNEWFRYHHLFSECLSETLKREDFERFTVAHQKAAAWCAENKLILEAVNYAVAIEDYVLARKIVTDHCEWIRRTEYGGAGYIQSVLDLIPDEEAHKDTRVLYMKAYACMSLGNFKDAKRYVIAGDTRIKSEGATPETLRDQIEVGTGVLSRVEWDGRSAAEWLGERLTLVDSLKAIDPSAFVGSGAMRMILAMVNLGYGDLKQAREYAQNANEDLDNLPDALSHVYLQTTFGLIEFWSNRPASARNRFANALELTREYGKDRGNLRYSAQLLLHVVEYWTGSEPVKGLDEAVSNAIEGDGWYDIYALGCDASVHYHLQNKDFDAADRIISQLEASTDRLAIRRLTELSQLLRLDYLVAVGDTRRATEVFSALASPHSVSSISVNPPTWIDQVFKAFSFARYLRSSNEVAAALEHIDRGLLEVSGQPDIVLLRVRGTILKASIMADIGEADRALELLKEAIWDAAKIGCLRAFLEDISSKACRQAAEALRRQGVDPSIEAFVERLSSILASHLISDRELQVLKAMANGHSNKQIARDLDLSPNTVKFHLRNIFEKLDSKNRVQATEKARAIGIVE